MYQELKYNAVNPYKKLPPTTEQILERYLAHKAKVQEYNIKNAEKGNKKSREYFRDKIKSNPIRYAEYKESKKKVYHLNNPIPPALPVKEFN